MIRSYALQYRFPYHFQCRTRTHPYSYVEVTMPATRALPTEEAVELIQLTRTLAAKELAPRVADAEADGAFPRDVFRTLGRSGLLGLPFAEEDGGADQPYEVYL